MLPSVWEYCQKHIAAGRSWPACPWDRTIPLYPFKLLELWHLLQIEKPRKILELGSGCTTAVFALYGAHPFITVDENQEYQDAIYQDLMAVGLPPVSRLFSERRQNDDGKDRRCNYNGIWNLEIAKELDFLYVDGPTNHMGKNDFAVCIDACLMNLSPPRTIAFDIRRESSAYAEKFYGESYHWEHTCWSEKDVPWYLSAARHHTVARRRA